MFPKDKTEFVVAMKTLCAGYDINYTDLRGDAYFGGLEKMSLGQFSQCVDHCLGPDSIFTDKMPKAPQLWKVWDAVKKDRRNADAPPAPQVYKPPVLTPMQQWVDNMFLIWLHRRRVLEEFRGDLNIELRRALCRELSGFLDGCIAEDIKPSLEEAQSMFAKAMARVA